MFVDPDGNRLQLRQGRQVGVGADSERADGKNRSPASIQDVLERAAIPSNVCGDVGEAPEHSSTVKPSLITLSQQSRHDARRKDREDPLQENLMHRCEAPQPSTREFARVISADTSLSFPDWSLRSSDDTNRLLANFVANPVLPSPGGRRRSARRGVDHHCTPPVLVERRRNPDLAVRLVPRPARRCAARSARAPFTSSDHPCDSVVGIRVAFSTLVLSGAWLTWVGWCTRAPHASANA